MKFINYLESITGIGIYPLVSFLIFFLFFIAVSIYVIKTNRSHFDLLAEIPLETTNQDFEYENN